MPYWTVQEEGHLKELVEQDKSIEELCEIFKRSPEALRLKLKRLGSPAPKTVSCEKSGIKVTTNATTTTPQLEPVKVEELPSPMQAMSLLWAAVKRLQEPGVSEEETRKLRLIVSGVKAYVHLDADYVLKIKHVETGMLIQNRYIASQLRWLIDQAKTPEEKLRLEKELCEVEQHIKEMLEMGIREPRIAKENKP
jgi:hypothetical protein